MKKHTIIEGEEVNEASIAFASFLSMESRKVYKSFPINSSLIDGKNSKGMVEMKSELIGLIIVLGMMPTVLAQDINWQCTGSIAWDGNAGNTASNNWNCQSAVIGVTGIQNVKFYVDNKLNRTEGTTPYYLCGDTNGVAYNCGWQGNHTIKADVIKNNAVIYSESFELNQPVLQSQAVTLCDVKINYTGKSFDLGNQFTPRDLVVVNGLIYVTDYESDSVLKYFKNGTPSGSFPVKGWDFGGNPLSQDMVDPHGIAFDGSNLLISIAHINSIFKYSPSGVYLDNLTVPMNHISQGMAFKDNKLYVMPFVNRTVQAYNYDLSDFSNSAHSGFSFTTSLKEYSPVDVQPFNDKFLIIGAYSSPINTTRSIFVYQSNGSYSGKEFYVGNIVKNAHGMSVDGSTLYVMDSTCPNSCTSENKIHLFNISCSNWVGSLESSPNNWWNSLSSEDKEQVYYNYEEGTCTMQ